MKKHSLLIDKLIFTSLVVVIYIICRNIPLYCVDTTGLMTKEISVQNILTQTVSGDLNQRSILALGIIPYMMSSIPVQMIAACRSADAKAHTSAKRMNRLIIILMAFFSVIQAFTRLDDLTFSYDGALLWLVKSVAVCQMVAGAFFILWLSVRNKKYGIGGQTALIYVNIMDSLQSNLSRHTAYELRLVLIIGIIGLIVMTFMENTEKRIPLQRISVYNVYGDRDYQAIKFNPIGVMPIMFASVFSMLPQLIAKVLLRIWPDNSQLIWFISNDTLNKPLGIAIYIAVLFILTISFSLLFINPGEMSEQMLKGGDSIVNIHAGHDTKVYLIKNVVLIGILSSVVMGICMGVPMLLQFSSNYDASLIMLPSSIMMMTGLWCNLFQEVKSVSNLDAYDEFL